MQQNNLFFEIQSQSKKKKKAKSKALTRNQKKKQKIHTVPVMKKKLKQCFWIKYLSK